MRNFIKLDNNGNVVCIINSSFNMDFNSNENIIDITDSKDKYKIKENPDYFKLQNNKLSEMTTAEKKVVDDSIKEKLPKLIKPEQKENLLITEINDLKARLNKLENKIKI